ncbi:MAG TPA: undecaprenyldiphospho-muramoylpentapeptide beta-N-acetylglucosaminyltransferase [Candidatus Paceibacterota bacterium]|nr:undecaprenyldiphospho-muramoylpentapeptide beta-N-acetylglucosaminyltransferase [Candidatus Paceibacterota bacterium]
MKIVFTGGGTGGHFFPIIAVAQKTNQIIDQEKIIGAKLYYVSNEPYDKQALAENSLEFREVTAGKLRIYSSIKNFFDLFKTGIGVIKATFKMFSIYPDVVFGKGGYASFPALFAARILRIPVVIHESDSAPGRVNMWAGKFAKRIAVSFPEAAEFFPKERVAWTGQPIRTELEKIEEKSKALDYFKFQSNLPVILILGGSQGAELINNTILDALSRLVEKYQIIHQTGVRNFKMVETQAEVVLGENPNKGRYMPLSFLSPLQMKMAAGAATIVVSRAGSTLFEIANWGVPSILIPFTESNADHSKKNAFNYARAGACSVIEEMNMTANILVHEIDNIVENKDVWARMSQNAKNFSKPDAAEKIAREIINIALSHEK